MTNPTSTKNAAVEALERLARDPNTVATVQRGIADLQTMANAMPNTGPLSGYKTYIVSALGIAGVVVVVGKAVLDGGGLTVGGMLSGLEVLITCVGFATIRAALAGNHAATTDNIAAVGQGIVMQLAAPAAEAVAGPAEAIGAALGAVEGAVGALIPR